MADSVPSVNSCLLLYGIKNARRPFVASLAGIHSKAQYADQELQLSTEFSFSTFEHSNGEKSLDLSSCDPSFYYAQSTPKQAARAHRSWLPPLMFQLPDEREYPALQPDDEWPMVSRRSTPLLPPPPLNGNSLSRNKKASNASKSIFSTSRPSTRRTSSVYSRPTSDSYFSRNASTLTSISSDSFDFALPNPALGSDKQSHPPSVPAMPAIPARYRHPSHSLRNGGQPLRPGSRPSMPPTEFWVHATAEQQNFNSFNRRPQTIWADTRTLRPRTGSGSSVGETRESYRPLVSSSPEKAVLRMNKNRANTMGNTMGVGKRSYESVRKDSEVCSEEVQEALRDRVERRTSRTLVKKRQPWDEEPRAERRRS